MTWSAVTGVRSSCAAVATNPRSACSRSARSRSVDDPDSLGSSAPPSTESVGHAKSVHHADGSVVGPRRLSGIGPGR